MLPISLSLNSFAKWGLLMTSPLVLRSEKDVSGKVSCRVGGGDISLGRAAWVENDAGQRARGAHSTDLGGGGGVLPTRHTSTHGEGGATAPLLTAPRSHRMRPKSLSWAAGTGPAAGAGQA